MTELAPHGPASHVERLRLTTFRTYERLELELPAGLTVLVGRNGVGKTNVLEAIAIACNGSSPRTSNELGCIREGSPGATVEAWVRTDDTIQHRKIQIVPGRGKLLTIDDAAADTGTSFGATLPVAVFLPERLLVVRGAPARRRQLLDAAVGQLEPSFAASSRRYATALVQRNSLLRRAKTGANVEQQIAPWSLLLAEHGVAMRSARAAAARELSPRFERRFRELTGMSHASIVIEHRGEPDIAESLLRAWPDDLRRGSTTIGPHLDDVRLLADDRDLRERGSTGEQRSALLAWTLATHDVVTASRPRAAPLLLDEPWAELDEHRQERLTAALTGVPQVIATATEPPLSVTSAGASIFEVTSGKVVAWTKTR